MSTPERIFVNGTASVFLGPAGTAEPADPAGPYDAALIEVGLFTDDSLLLETNAEFQPVIPAQGDYPVAWLQTSEEASLSVDLQEWSARNFTFAFGGGTVTETAPGSGVWRYEPPAYGARDEVMAVVRCIDGDRTYALVCPRAQQVEGVEQNLGKGAESLLPLRLDLFGDEASPPFYWLTDDPLYTGDAPPAPIPLVVLRATAIASPTAVGTGFGLAVITRGPGGSLTLSPAGVATAAAFGTAVVAAGSAPGGLFPAAAVFPSTTLFPNGA